jgi:hypothetical protein
MRIRMRALLLGAAMLWLGSTLASSADALPVHVEFEAVVRVIYSASAPGEPVWMDVADDLSALGVELGAPVQGTLRYDDAAVFLGAPYHDPSGADLSASHAALSRGPARRSPWWARSPAWTRRPSRPLPRSSRSAWER